MGDAFAPSTGGGDASHKPSLPNQPTRLQNIISEIVSIKVVFSLTVLLMGVCLAVVIAVLATTSISSTKSLREKYVGYIMESKVNDIKGQLELPHVLAESFVGQSINRNVLTSLDQFTDDSHNRAMLDFLDIAYDFTARVPAISSVTLRSDVPGGNGLGVGIAAQSDLISCYKTTKDTYSLKLGSRKLYLEDGTYPTGQFFTQPQNFGPWDRNRLAYEQGLREYSGGVTIADKTPVLFTSLEYVRVVTDARGGYRGSLVIGYGLDFMARAAKDIEEIDGDRILMLELDGAVLASSEGDLPFVRGTQYTEAWPLIHSNEWSRSFSANHTKKWIREASQIAMSVGNGELTIEGKKYLIYTRRLDGIMPGYIIAVIPRDFALGESERAITRATVIAAASSLVMVVVVLVMAVALLRAIANLTHAVDQSAGLNFQKVAIRLTKIKELSVLQDRFQHMSNTLQQVSRYIPDATLNVYRRVAPIEELADAPTESGQTDLPYIVVTNNHNLERRDSGASSATSSSVGRHSQQLAVLYIEVAERSPEKHDQLYLTKYSGFLAQVGKAIAERGGVLDIVHEEGLTITFNAFLANPDPVVNAARAAWDIAKLSGSDFAVYIGLSAGSEFVKGELGSESVRRMTTIGLVPRVARTFARIAREANLAVLCCCRVARQLEKAFYVVGCDRVTVGLRHGKSSGRTLHALMYSKDSGDDEWMYKLQSDSLNNACEELNRVVEEGRKQPGHINHEQLKKLSSSLPPRAGEQFSAAFAYYARVCLEKRSGRTLPLYRAALSPGAVRATTNEPQHDHIEVVQ